MSLCNTCTGICCKSINVPITPPETPHEWDIIRWYLSRPGSRVYRQQDTWWLTIDSTCHYLGPKNLCMIYEKRPRICREYVPGENCEHSWSMDWYDICELTERRLHFSTDVDVEQYYLDLTGNELPQRDSPGSNRGPSSPEKLVQLTIRGTKP